MHFDFLSERASSLFQGLANCLQRAPHVFVSAYMPLQNKMWKLKHVAVGLPVRASEA